MNIAKSFEVAFNRKKLKNWEKIYVIVDIHDTIVKACYDSEETFQYFPLAKEALQLLSARDDVTLILWSSCHDEQMKAYLKHFEEDGIHFDFANENPEVTNNKLSNFDQKLYFNVGIDDKFGFEPEKDWEAVIECLAEQ